MNGIQKVVAIVGMFLAVALAVWAANGSEALMMLVGVCGFMVAVVGAYFVLLVDSSNDPSDVVNIPTGEDPNAHLQIKPGDDELTRRAKDHVLRTGHSVTIDS